MEPLMLLLADKDLDYGVIPLTSQALNIPIDTLRSWRRDLLKNPQFRPYSQPANISKRALDFEEEQRVRDELRNGYLIPGLYCPSRVLQNLAVRAPNIATDNDEEYDSDDEEVELNQAEEPMFAEPPTEERVVRAVRDHLEFQDHDPSHDLEYVDEDARVRPRRKFVAGRHWRRNFMRRWRLSLRKPHAKRRPKTDPEAVDRFQRRMTRLLSRTRPERVINMDETSWKQINNGFVTIAEKGAETVECFFSGDPKTCLTAVAAVDAAGGKLPLWILCRGKTTRCETRYRTHDGIDRAVNQGKLVVSHQVNGWCNATIAAEYLRWLRSRYGRLKIVLLWDIWGAHRSKETKELARQLNIQLEFIPAGQTGECQPLDRRLFGNLKSRARSRFDQMCSRREDPTMQDSVAMLVDAWNSIGQDEVLDAWAPLLP
jgi:hypothetical protein